MAKKIAQKKKLKTNKNKSMEQVFDDLIKQMDAQYVDMLSTNFEYLRSHAANRKVSVLGKKAEEYSTPTDRMHNFREIAKIMRMHELDVVKALLGKHLVSVIDMIEDIKQGKVFTPEYIDEKVGDLDNYTSPLLEFLVREKNFENKLMNKELEEFTKKAVGENSLDFEKAFFQYGMGKDLKEIINKEV